MLRLTKILLVATVAAWAFLGALGNVTDWNGTIGAVSAATSMSTFDEVPASGRATSHPAVIWAGALFILSLKLLTGAMCAAGATRMWLARKADAAAFAGAKTLALTGCGVAMFMLFAGWIVIAETWYELWRSAPMLEPVLGSAFRYFGIIGLTALYVGADEPGSS